MIINGLRITSVQINCTEVAQKLLVILTIINNNYLKQLL